MSEWIFTFGHGQRLVPPKEPDVEGFPLTDRFVRITGSWDAARAEMVRRFGSSWSMQYPSEDEAGVRKYHLRELT